MLELKENQLHFSFPEVHPEAKLTIEFQRTLRIPDDGTEYPLPPGLGRFDVAHVDDHARRVPPAWRTRGGVMLPIYQSEAMWLRFQAGEVKDRHGCKNYPFAIKIGSGKINAVTGEPWDIIIDDAEQDYVVVPGQRWLDGFRLDDGTVRQFVAMPLGEGYTAEEQITGEAKHGGLQIMAFPMKREVFGRRFEKRIFSDELRAYGSRWRSEMADIRKEQNFFEGRVTEYSLASPLEAAEDDELLGDAPEPDSEYVTGTLHCASDDLPPSPRASRSRPHSRSLVEWQEARAEKKLERAMAKKRRRAGSRPKPDMGLAPGGLMKQEIRKDIYGAADWDQSNTSRCFVHLANSEQWRAITRGRPGHLPPTAKQYSDAGLPWFDEYGADPAVAVARPAGGVLACIKSVFRLGRERGEEPLPENGSAQPKKVVKYKAQKSYGGLEDLIAANLDDDGDL